MKSHKQGAATNAGYRDKPININHGMSYCVDRGVLLFVLKTKMTT